MADKPTSIRAAQALAIFASAGSAGLSLGVSALVLPRLLESPTPLMLRQWARLLEAGKRTFPALAAAAAAPYWFLAYRFWGGAGWNGGTRAGWLYLVAGGLCVGTVPYTLAVVMPTNRRLLRKVEQTRMLGEADEVVETGAREESAKYLVDHWGLLHMGRVVMIAAAGMIGLGASL